MNEETGFGAEELRKNYRCVIGILPRADSAIFIEHQDGSLAFQNWIQDEPRPPNESGYLGSFEGDSGSPYLTSTKDDEGKERQVIVAVHHAGFRAPEITKYQDDPLEKCRMKATKISSDVLQWLGKIMNYERICETKNVECQQGLKGQSMILFGNHN